MVQGVESGANVVLGMWLCWCWDSVVIAGAGILWLLLVAGFCGGVVVDTIESRDRVLQNWWENG